MAVDEDTTKKRPKVPVDRPTIGDLQIVLHGLRGMFWALNMLSSQQAADELDGEYEIQNGIANLIVAGERLTDEITSRF